MPQGSSSASARRPGPGARLRVPSARGGLKLLTFGGTVVVWAFLLYGFLPAGALIALSVVGPAAAAAGLSIVTGSATRGPLTAWRAATWA